jgi:hypothetical protein
VDYSSTSRRGNMAKKLFAYAVGLFVRTVVFISVVVVATNGFVEFVFGAFGLVCALGTVVCGVAAVLSHLGVEFD